MPVELRTLIQSQQSAHSLQQAFYTSPDIYRHDMERIFFNDWIYACHVSELKAAGDCHTFDIDQESIIVCRDNELQIHAMANVCRHRGSRLCETGASKHTRLACPYHGWAYGLDGSLQVARLMPEGFDKSQHGLKKIAIEVFCGVIFVNLSNTPASFEPVRRGLQEAFAVYDFENTRVAHYESHPIRANWKLVYENFFECYHCGPAHKEYAASHALSLIETRRAPYCQQLAQRVSKAGTSIAESTYDENADPAEPQFYHQRSPLYEGFLTASENGQPVAPLLGDIQAYDGGAADIMIGTLTYLVAYSDHAVLYRFTPRSVDLTDAELFWFVRADASEADVDMERMRWLWHVTTLADKDIIERNQQGVLSRFYQPGPYSPMEAPTKGFVDWYLQRIS